MSAEDKIIEALAREWLRFVALKFLAEARIERLKAEAQANG